MAASPTTEASEIRRRGRQRLIGAVALVLLLVVFVPMVLDSEPRPTRESPALAIPSKSSAPPLPAPVAPAAAPKAASESKVAAIDPKAAATPPKAAAEPAKAPANKATKAPTPAKADPQAALPAAQPAAAPKLEGFAVQVGAFRDEAMLKQARERIVAAGITHYTERIDASGGPLTRLRAGPFASREAAELALAALKRASLEGKVIPLP